MTDKIKNHYNIFIADPNAIIATNNNYTNATPPYEDMTPYVELYCIRKKGVTITLNEGNPVRNEGNPIAYNESTGYTIEGENSVQRINFLGFDEATKTYTTKYNNDIRNADGSTSSEGFGVTSINIKMNANYMPMVEITFVDVRGSALLFQGEKSPLAALFDYPPPIFKLRMKGAFGKFVEYDLHMTGNDVSYTDKGDYEIKARFIGEFFGPLTDVLLGYLKSVPYLKNLESSLDGNSPEITNLHGGQVTTVNSFFELINKGELLYAKVDNFKNNSTAIPQMQKLQELPKKVNDINSYLSSIINIDSDSFKNFVKTNAGTTTGADKIKKSLYKGNRYSIAFSFVKSINETNPIYITSEDFILKSYIDSYINKFLVPEIQKQLNQLNTVTPPLNIEAIKFIDLGNDSLDTTTYTAYVNYERLYNELNVRSEASKVQVRELQEKLGNTVGDIVSKNIDLYPTIGNVFEILLKDFDYFLSQIKKAGEESKTTYSSNFTSNSDVRMIGDAPWPEVVLRKQTSMNYANGNNITQDVLIYPGSDTANRFANWGEVKLVERYCESLVEQVRQETKIDNFKSIIDSSKYIPLFPLEAAYVDEADDKNQYLKADSLANLYRILLSRYVVTRDYAYPILFNAESDDNYRTTFSQKISRFSKGATIINQDTRKSLIKALAKAEAVNAANALAGTSLLTALNEVSGNKISVMQQELATAQRNNSGFLSAFEDGLLLKTNYTVASLKFRNKNLVYRNNPKFKGIRDIINPELTDFRTLVAKKIEDGSDYEKERLELLKSLGDTIWGSNDSLTPIVSEANTLIFKDARANSSTNRLDTDFVGDIGDNGDYVANMLTSQVKNILNNPNPQAELQRTLNTADKFFSYFNNLSNNIASDDNLTFAKVTKKFLYPGAIEVPYWYVLYIGYKLKNDIGTFGSTISLLDKQLFINYYKEFEQTYVTDILDTIKSRINSDALTNPGNLSTDEDNQLTSKVKEYAYIKLLAKPRYIINDSSATFLSPENFTYNPPLTGFRSAKIVANDDTLNLYLDTFFSELTSKLQTSNKKTEDSLKDIEGKIRDNDFKANIYYSFKAIYDRWLAGKTDFQSDNSGVVVSPLYERFKFITRSQQNIADICIVDFQSLLTDSKNPEMNVFTAISRLLGNNQFMFFPLHSFMDYDKGPGATDNWLKSFQITNDLKSENISKPAFVCMYVGSYSSRLPSAQESTSYQDDGFTFDDGTNISKTLPPDFTDANNEKSSIFAFRVRIGSQSQSIFSGFSMNTTEFKNTDISLKTENDIINKQTEVSRPTKSQSLLNIYKQRAYSMGATIPLGNLCIQPTQYFQIEGVPIWNGAYMVYSVEHTMSAGSNKINTSFKGYRLGKYVIPVVNDYLLSFLGISTDLNTQVNTIVETLPTNNRNVKYKPENDYPGLAYSSLIPYSQPIKDAFIQEVIAIGRRLKLNANGLMAVMYLESGLRANIVSTSASHATGLIQFVGQTALGFTDFYNRNVRLPNDPIIPVLTLSVIRAIDPVRQLKLVEEYLRRGMTKNGKPKSFWNMYLTIFQPKYQDASDNTILYSRGSKAYTENSGFDTNKKGYVTIADFKNVIYKRIVTEFNQGKSQFDQITS